MVWHKNFVLMIRCFAWRYASEFYYLWFIQRWLHQYRTPYSIVYESIFRIFHQMPAEEGTSEENSRSIKHLRTSRTINDNVRSSGICNMYFIYDMNSAVVCMKQNFSCTSNGCFPFSIFYQFSMDGSFAILFNFKMMSKFFSFEEYIELWPVFHSVYSICIFIQVISFNVC